MKKCKGCGKCKPLDEFYKPKCYKGKTLSRCKNCLKKQSYDWQIANRDRDNERRRKLYKENVDRIGVYFRDYYKKVAEVFRDRSRKNYAANREKKNAKVRQWQINNPEWMKDKAHRRRAQKFGNGGGITSTEWSALLEKCGYKCLCCGRDNVKLEIDHVVPLARGGAHAIDNIQPLCKKCNSSKNAKTIDYRISERTIS